MQDLTLKILFEAPSSIESFQPNVMLIDIGLPDMDGYQLVQQLAKLPSGKDVRKSR